MPRKTASAVKASKAPKGKPGRKPGSKNKVTAPAAQQPAQPTWPPASTSTLTPEQAQAKLAEWYALRQKLEGEFNALIDTEMALRKELFAHFNPVPEEGTTKLELGNGWRLEMEYGLDRKFDVPAMDGVFAQLPPGSKDYLVRYKPELQVKVYKDMPAELRKIVDQCVVTKPKAPVLRLVPPASDAAS